MSFTWIQISGMQWCKFPLYRNTETYLGLFEAGHGEEEFFYSVIITKSLDVPEI